jgi:hypothetical protein
MNKKIKMEFEKGGTIIATLFEDDAPQTCTAVLSALPYEHEMIHAMWAGQEIFFDGLPTKEDVPFENATKNINPGEVVLFATTKSFCIFYGKGIPRGAVDKEIEINVFGRVDDIEEMTKIGLRIRRQGVEKVRITAI